MGDNRIKGTRYEDLIKSKVWLKVLGSQEIPNYIEEQVRSMLKERVVVLKPCEKRALANFIKHEVSLNDLRGQLELFRKLKAPKGNSLENYIVKYGPVHGPKKYEQKNKDSTVTLERYIEKYGESEGKILWDQLNSKKFHSEQTYIAKYGESEGKIKWEEFKNNCSKNKTLEKHIHLYGEQRGTESFNKLRNKEHNRSSLEWYIQIYGDERGTQLFNLHIKKLRHGSSLQGYIEKYGEDLGRKLCKERHDHNSLTSFQKRYGASEGYKRYTNLVEKHTYMKSIKFYIDTYGETEGEKLYLKYKSKQQCTSSASKVSQKLFWQILGALDSNEHNSYFMFYEHNGEFTTYSKTDSKCYMYDFMDMKSKKCIEFHGDVFHGNPSIFTGDDTPHPWRREVTCKQLWEEDMNKMDVLVKRGFEVLVIWEKEYYNDPHSTLIKCLDFLNYDYTIKN